MELVKQDACLAKLMHYLFNIHPRLLAINLEFLTNAYYELIHSTLNPTRLNDTGCYSIFFVASLVLVSSPSICASVLTRLVETRTHDEPNKRLAVMLHYLVLLSISELVSHF